MSVLPWGTAGEVGRAWVGPSLSAHLIVSEATTASEPWARARCPRGPERAFAAALGEELMGVHLSREVQVTRAEGILHTGGSQPRRCRYFGPDNSLSWGCCPCAGRFLAVPLTSSY